MARWCWQPLQHAWQMQQLYGALQQCDCCTADRAGIPCMRAGLYLMEHLPLSSLMWWWIQAFRCMRPAAAMPVLLPVMTGLVA